MTSAHWEKAREEAKDKVHAWTQVGDGTSKNHIHLESFLVHLPDGSRVAMVPFQTGSKAGELVAKASCKELEHAQDAYQLVYNSMTPEQQTIFGPEPAPRGILITNISNTVNDHAGNEKTRSVKPVLHILPYWCTFCQSSGAHFALQLVLVHHFALQLVYIILPHWLVHIFPYKWCTFYLTSGAHFILLAHILPYWCIFCQISGAEAPLIWQNMHQ